MIAPRMAQKISQSFSDVCFPKLHGQILLGSGKISAHKIKHTIKL